jgi:hypothetical protein
VVDRAGTSRRASPVAVDSAEAANEAIDRLAEQKPDAVKIVIDRDSMRRACAPRWRARSSSARAL